MMARTATSVLSILFIIGSALLAKAGPVEERCAELGAACVCSEPLRYAAGGRLAVGRDENPPDSQGADAKECAGGNALRLDGNEVELVSAVDNASGLDFPGRLPPAYVLKMTATTDDQNNDWSVLGSLPTGVSEETVCSRSYQRFANDLTTVRDPDTDQRIKLQEAIIKQPQHDLAIELELVAGSGGLGINPDCDDFPRLDFQLEGRTSWIRHEVCYDVSAGTVTARQRATLIETGQSEIRTCTKKISTPADFLNYQIANLYLQTGGDRRLAGSRYVTYAIQTRGPLDPQFWPGAALELEADSDNNGVVDLEERNAQVTTVGPRADKGGFSMNSEKSGFAEQEADKGGFW